MNPPQCAYGCHELEPSPREIRDDEMPEGLGEQEIADDPDQWSGHSLTNNPSSCGGRSGPRRIGSSLGGARLDSRGPPHQPRARSSGPRCRRCLPRPPAPAATAGRPFGSARRLHPRDVAVAERFLDRYVFRCTHPPRPSNLRCAAQLLPSETPPPAQGRHHQTLPHGRAASSVCRSARPGPLAAASIGRKPRI